MNETTKKQIDTICADVTNAVKANSHTGEAGYYIVTNPVNIAQNLYYKGYRRASDVAKEIFEEIEEGVKAAVSALQFENNPIHKKVKHEAYSSLMRFIKIVGEKHTEERE